MSNIRDKGGGQEENRPEQNKDWWPDLVLPPINLWNVWPSTYMLQLEKELGIKSKSVSNGRAHRTCTSCKQMYSLRNRG